MRLPSQIASKPAVLLAGRYREITFAAAIAMLLVVGLLGYITQDPAEHIHAREAILMLGTGLAWLVTAVFGVALARLTGEMRRSERAALTAEAQNRTLLDEVHDCSILMLNPRGDVATESADAARIHGYEPQHLVGRNFSAFFSGADIQQDRPAEILRMTAAVGRHEESVMRVRRDGSLFPATVTYAALRDPSGQLRGFFEITFDRSEAAESDVQYRALMDAAPDAMVVVNESGAIVLLNRQAEKQFGYRRGELLGQMVTRIVPNGFTERLLADGLRTAEEALAQQIGTGIELNGCRRDGTEFPIEIMLSPLRTAEGVLVTAAIRNISVRKHVELYLAQMESRYRGLLEAAPDGMIVADTNGCIVLLNLQAEKQFGYRRDELLGQPMTRIIPDGFAERLVADGLRSAEDALGQQIGTGIELQGLRKDGSEFPIELMLSPLESAGGILVTAAIRDISARKKADALLLQKIEELHRSNDELQQFANIASHDLQEPLRMVASYTTLLARRYKGKLDADADDFIAFAVDGANRMQHLIQDLLSFSRVGSQGRQLVDTSSESALQLAIRNLRATMETSGAEVTYGPLPAVLADETQLIQLFQNLLGNAIKYRSADIPQVHVSAERNTAGKWVFSVQDNGLGIEAQYFERIFGMFQRLHKREEFEGTGIGLAICKKIVERHGGSISVASIIGHGSTFSFPLSASSVPLPAIAAARAAPAAAATSPRPAVSA
jgi:PAS domain S-box-containing protein